MVERHIQDNNLDQQPGSPSTTQTENPNELSTHSTPPRSNYRTRSGRTANTLKYLSDYRTD